MKKLMFLILLLSCLLFSGCEGYREIDRGYFVTAIAFLREGENTTVFVEALSSSDVIEEKSERVVLKGVGTSAKAALESLEKALVKPLYFEHLGAVILENEMVENLDFLKQNNGINGGAYIVKTDDAATLFENDSPSGVLGYDAVNLIKKHNKNTTRITVLNAYNIALPTLDFKDGAFILQWMEK